MSKNNNDSKNGHQFSDLANGNNSNNSKDVTSPETDARSNLCDDPTVAPAHIVSLMCSEQERYKKNIRNCYDFHVNPTQIPSRVLFLKNLDHFNRETLIALFQCYGVIRECTKHNDFVLVRYQTLAMANKAKISIVEEFKKRKVTISIIYGQVICTPRIWIGGMCSNISEEEIINELEHVENIKNITWSRNFKEAEVYILYRNRNDAKKSINEMHQRGCILKASKCPVQVGFTDICSLPFQHKNCRTLTDISDKCLTQIPTDIKINSLSTSAKLHFIAGDCSIAERLAYQEYFQLPVTTISKASNVSLDDVLFYSNSIFLGVFAPTEEESANKIIAFLAEDDSVGFSQLTFKDETFVSVIVRPSDLSTYLMTYYFEHFLSNDERNQIYIVVIVLRKPSPSEIRPGGFDFNCTT